MDITRIGKTALPAVVVLVAGLFGINFVYNSYLTDGAASVITLEPAAGEEGVMVSIEDGVTPVTAEEVDALVTDVTETVTDPSDACDVVDAAAAEAIGTDAEAATAQAAAECHGTTPVVEEAETQVEETAVETVVEEDTATDTEEAVEESVEETVEE